MEKKKHSHLILRYFLVVVSFVAIFLLGFVRDQYIINIINPDLPLLIDRMNMELPVNPVENGNDWQDPRFFNLPMYILLYIAFTVLSLYLIFLQKNVLQLAFLGYGILSLLCGGLLVLYFFLSQHYLFYSLAQQLKEFMLSPFLLLLLIATYSAFLKKQSLY